MKKYLIGCLALIIMGLASPLTAKSKNQTKCVPGFDPANVDSFWGPYVGANVGPFAHFFDRNDLDGFLTDNSSWSSMNNGVAGGAQMGWDWQFKDSILGIVGDWNWTSNNTLLREESGDPNDNHYINNDFKWYTTIRARAGVALQQSIFYFTVGAAAAKFRVEWSDLTNESVGDKFSYNNTRWGWVMGAGTEFKLCSSLSIGGEALLMNFGNTVQKYTDPFISNYSFGQADSAWTARMYINYRFKDLLQYFQ